MTANPQPKNPSAVAGPRAPSRLPYSSATAALRRVLGYLLMFVAFLGLLSEKVIGEAHVNLALEVVLRIVVGLGSVAVGLGGRHLVVTGKQQRAVLASRDRSADSRPPVVYLRSFAADRRVADAHMVDGFIQLSTEEEQFAKVLHAFGPVVAIGDPREKLPTLGADRVYVGNEAWQKKVLGLLSTAHLVLLRLSPTAGVQWELQQVVGQVDPSRFLLFLPLGYKYPALKAMAETWLPKPLPKPPRRRTRIGTLQGIVRFHPDWTPEFVPARFAFMRMSLRTPISPHLKIMLRPVFEQLGVRWTPPAIGVFSVLLLLLYASGALIFLRLLLR